MDNMGKNTFTKGNALYLGGEGDVQAKAKRNAVYLVWKDRNVKGQKCTNYWDFILEGYCIRGLKGQGKAEDVGFGPVGQHNEVYEYPESISRLLSLSSENSKFSLY